jgi:hypothetical protein
MIYIDYGCSLSYYLSKFTKKFKDDDLEIHKRQS